MTIFKVLIAFGTRPEAIKMAPVVNSLKCSDILQTQVLVTAQHRAMLDQVLRLFDIKPDYDLDLMRENQDLFEITSAILSGVRNILADYKPDLVLVHGDTTTAMAISLAAFYLQIPVAHVEAGLRTGDLLSPWPEEMNRRFVTMTANLHFAPTEDAKINLINENVDPRTILVTGNTVVDALKMISLKLNNEPSNIENVVQKFGFDNEKKLILVTGHRRENFGLGFERICKAILKLAERDDVQIVYPVHLNPNVQKPVTEMLSGHENITLIKPLEYLPFVHLMKHSYLILTDSGGIQEEAPSLGKPVILMRNTTERPEAVDAGSVKLVGTEVSDIVHAAESILDNREMYLRMANAVNPYGDGLAATRIFQTIEKLANDTNSMGL